MTRVDEDSVHRRTVLSLVGSIAVASQSASGASGAGGKQAGSQGGRNDRDEFPQVPKQKIPDEPITEYAHEIAFHPNQRRAAITTGMLGDGFELYVVQRVSGPDSKADAIWRITDNDGIVGGIAWDKNNRIRYDEWFTRYERKLPPSHKVFEPSVVEELSFRGINSL